MIDKGRTRALKEWKRRLTNDGVDAVSLFHDLSSIAAADF
jgi:hypothetical protein